MFWEISQKIMDTVLAKKPRGNKEEIFQTFDISNQFLLYSIPFVLCN